MFPSNRLLPQMRTNRPMVNDITPATAVDPGPSGGGDGAGMQAQILPALQQEAQLRRAQMGQDQQRQMMGLYSRTTPDMQRQVDWGRQQQAMYPMQSQPYAQGRSPMPPQQSPQQPPQGATSHDQRQQRQGYNIYGGAHQSALQQSADMERQERQRQQQARASQPVQQSADANRDPYANGGGGFNK